jgi:OmpA-OmpF porin, OOP family
VRLEIGGHTDADGDPAKNLTLSTARAEAVKKLLVDQGIDAARLTTKGYGATKPIDSNTTPEDKANNRRVEFVKL